jgi:hypothetical protein
MLCSNSRQSENWSTKFHLEQSRRITLMHTVPFESVLYTGYLGIWRETAEFQIGYLRNFHPNTLASTQ